MRDPKFRVVVCGSHKDDANREFLFRAMEELHTLHRFTDLMQGGAPGYDRFAKEWAETHPEITPWEFRAEWSKFGRAAGPIRNKRMADWKPDLVIAFPGHDGTADMVRQARAAGIEVFEVNP